MKVPFFPKKVKSPKVKYKLVLIFSYLMYKMPFRNDEIISKSIIKLRISIVISPQSLAVDNLLLKLLVFRHITLQTSPADSYIKNNLQLSVFLNNFTF